MKVDESGLVQSVRARLLGVARATRSEPNIVLARYGIERFLYRLSVSPHADRFVLKGAMLLTVWLREDARPTRDIDLLGLGPFTLEELAEIARDACVIECAADGMTYARETVKVSEIRTSGKYRGARITLAGGLGRARVKVQVDVGVGDSTAPGPTLLELPSLLDLPRPQLHAYRPETVVAEKVHAMVVLAEMNTRLKDVHDVAALSRHVDFNGATLASAIEATFAGRGTALPEGLPAALTDEFVEDSARKAQWRAFLKRSRLDSSSVTLESAAGDSALFLAPVLDALRGKVPFNLTWKAPGPWRPGCGKAKTA